MSDRGPATVTVALEKAEADALRAALSGAGWSDQAPPEHAAWAARGPGANAVYYRSGKLVLQGRGAADAAASFLGAAHHPAAPREELSVPTVGSDESGKGDFLGPLVVAAVLVRPGQEEVLRTLGVRDSKTMSDAEVAEAAPLMRDGFPSAVVLVPPVRYNELHGKFGRNLNRLLAWAHARAIEDVLERPDAADASALVVDRFASGDTLRSALLPRAGALPLDERPRAEAHPSVAAASVVARGAFLDALRRLGSECGVRLAKGAGPPADAAARRVVARGGRALLATVAKMHFKNAGRPGVR